MKKSIYLVCLIAGILLGNTAYGQTTVGSNIKANSGALLDIKQKPGDNTDNTGGETGDKGLGLPRVTLENLASLVPLVTDSEVIADPNLKLLHVGSIVFNTNEDVDKNLASGLYAWNGTGWASLNVYSASFSVSTDKANMPFSMKKYGTVPIPSQELKLQWSGTAMCRLDVINGNNGGVTNARFYDVTNPPTPTQIMTGGVTFHEFTDPSGKATIKIEVDEDLAFTDEEDQKTTLLRFTIVKAGTSLTKTYTVTLRQFIYFAKILKQYPAYPTDGSEQYFVVRSNAPYKVSLTTNPNGVIVLPFTSTNGGSLGDYKNEDIRFTMKDAKTLSSQTAVFKIEPTITDQFSSFNVPIVSSPIEIVDASNSYILKPNSGAILIPVSRANEDGVKRLKSSEPEFVPELIWTDAPQGVAPNGNIAQLSIAGKGTDGHLYVLPGSREGNSLVAIRSRKTGNILWSWHIWSTNYDPNGDYSSVADGEIATTGGSVFKYDNSAKITVFMDRSLGARGLTPSTADPIGLYYQWGRKDPFLPPAVDSYNVNYCYDGVAVYDADGKYLLQGIPTGGDIFNVILVKDTDRDNIDQSVLNPTTFIRTANGNNPLTVSNNWYAGRTYINQWRDDLWNDRGNKTVYDPCPTGWRVPTSGPGTESPWYFSPASTSTDPTRASNYGANWIVNTSESVTQAYGAYFTHPSFNIGYYPMGGMRQSNIGYLSGMEIETGFWSATAGPTKDDSPYYLRFSFNNQVQDQIFNPSEFGPFQQRSTIKFYSTRTQGYNVRCVHE